MKKKIIVAISCLAVAIIGFGACGSGNSPGNTAQAVASNPEVGELVVAHIFASTSVQNQGAVMFSKLVSERTNGTYKLDVYPAAQLGNMNDILEQQKSGDIHMQIISSVALANISAFCFIDSWPYMFENQAQWEKAYKSDAVKEWIERCEKDSGFYLLAPTYKGFRHFYVNKEIKTLRDLAGIKIRCSGSPPEMDKFRVWGMAPTAMSSTEVFAAMQQGVVDAYEQELPVAADESIPEVTKTVVLTHHTAANYIWPVYQNWLNSMPADFQKTYREIARECSDFITKTIVDLEKPALQKFIDAGAKVIEPDMTEWAKISDTTYAANWPDLAYYALRIKEAGK